MRSHYCAAVSVSSNNRDMVVSGSRVQHRWLPRSDVMVDNCVHIHVDISRSLFSCTQTVALWNGANENTVSHCDPCTQFRLKTIGMAMACGVSAYEPQQNMHDAAVAIFHHLFFFNFANSNIVFFFSIYANNRCQCWMAFTWISSAMLCCPPFLSGSTTFDEDAYICKLNWSNISAYSITLAILVLGPSVISIVHNFGYIFIMMRRIRSGAPIHDKEYATALAENLANPSHLMSFALVFSFIVSWTPFISVRSYEVLFNTTINFPLLNFALVWFGIMNSFWKILIMTSMSPQFRLALRVFCLTICCKTKGRLQAELIGMDPDD